MQKQRGFTIIELSISIFILAIAIIGAYNAFTIMDILTSNSSDRFTAAYLAQEGVEIVRNIRDTNWLESASWTDGLEDCESGCQADYKTFGTTETPLKPWTGTDADYLCMENNFYVLDDECADQNVTRFKRKITITPIQTPGEEDDILKVEVEVSWTSKKGAVYFLDETSKESIIAEEYLYNWNK